MLFNIIIKLMFLCLQVQVEKLRAEADSLKALVRSLQRQLAATKREPAVPSPHKTLQNTRRNHRFPSKLSLEEHRALAEQGLSDWHAQRWGHKIETKHQWRESLLCNIDITEESYYWAGHRALKHQNRYQTVLVDEAGSQIPFNATQGCSAAPPALMGINSTVVDRWKKVLVNGKVLTVDDIVYGYERLFETRAMYSAINFMGVALQQDPNDAFVIADMLWRVQPDLVIELGTSGGGSAHFFAHIMEAYNSEAKILTMDPSILKLTDKKPLVNWNFREIRLMCPHCVAAKDTEIWSRGKIRFLRNDPLDPEAVAIAEAMAANATRVVVIEDSAHKYKMVLDNIRTYGRFVTPGSYMLVQDTRSGRWEPAAAVSKFLDLPEGAEFRVDRRWEYLLYTQHTGGWLRREE